MIHHSFQPKLCPSALCNNFIMLLDPQLWREGSYETGSVHPSIIPSFRRIDSLVFSEIQHGSRGLCVVVGDRARFFEKKKFGPKMRKMDQNRVF